MKTHRIYDLTVVNLIKCICNLGSRAVNMLQAPRHFNPVLVVAKHLQTKIFYFESEWF